MHSGAQGLPARVQRSGQQRIDLPLFIAQLRDLLTAGLSVIEALGALRRGGQGSRRHHH
jgi:type II secretory pathway component PulF